MFDSVRSVQEIAARGPRAGAISPDLISDYVAGRALLNQSIESDPELVEAILHLADSWSGVDDERAISLYERAFQVDADNPRTLAAHRGDL